MTLRYPSSLQKRYANTVLPGLSHDSIVDVLAKTDDETFDQLCISPEFRSYCSKNSIFSERLYEERVKRRFAPDILVFKSREMKWREFYYRILYFMPNFYIYQSNLLPELDKLNIINQLAEVGKLMELKIYYDILGKLPNHLGASRAFYRGHIEVLDWLAEKEVFTKIDEEGWATENGKLPLVKWLYKQGIKPTIQNLITAEKNHHYDVVDWAIEKGIIPDSKGGALPDMAATFRFGRHGNIV